jgi:hypothetical protein
MYAIPNSSAMDAAAGGGGPTSTVLPWIVSTEPQQVLKYVTDLAGRITTIAGIVARIDTTRGSLRQAWPSGSASDAAIAKVTDTIRIFDKITKAVQSVQAEIQAVATALNLVQNVYRSVVGSVNPTVAALLSNVHTRAAATALSVNTTSGLASAVSSTKATLDTIGIVRLAAIASQLATIASELGSLLSGGAAVPAGTTPAVAPGTAGSSAGPGSAGAGGFGATNPGALGGSTSGGYGTGGWNDGAIGSTGTATTPFGTGHPVTLPDLSGSHAGGGDVTISTTHGDLDIDISVPATAADDLSIDVTVTEGGETFTEHIDLDAARGGAART